MRNTLVGDFGPRPFLHVIKELEMSDKLREDLRKELDEILWAQRECSWCGEIFDTAHMLIEHILVYHPKPE